MIAREAIYMWGIGEIGDPEGEFVSAIALLVWREAIAFYLRECDRFFVGSAIKQGYAVSAIAQKCDKFLRSFYGRLGRAIPFCLQERDLFTEERSLFLWRERHTQTSLVMGD